MKRMISLVLGFAMLISLFGGVTASANEEVEKLQWKLSLVSIGHTGLSFRLDNVDAAQNAFVCVGNMGEGNEIVRCPFSITSSSQKFELDFAGGKSLAAGNYVVWVEDRDGARTEPDTGSVSKHSLYLYSTSIKAYPNRLTGYDHDNKISRIYAEVAFKKYEAVKGEYGFFEISYPKQAIGTEVKLYLEDGYGCQSVTNVSIRDKYMSVPRIEVWRDGVSFMSQSLDRDERICVEINGTVYYSEYGASEKGEGKKMVVTYPPIPQEIKEVSVWMESTVGSRSEKENYTVKDCELSEYNVTLYAYPKKVIGNVRANDCGQKPTLVSATIEGKEYSTEISEDGSFSLSYPLRKEDDSFPLVFRDAHGCHLEHKAYVRNSHKYSSVNTRRVLLQRLEAYRVPMGTRVYVSIDGKEYASEVSTKENDGRVTVSYPRQKPGTALTAWIQDDRTSEMTDKPAVLKIADKQYDCQYLAETDRINGTVYLDDRDENFQLESNVTSASVVIDGKIYPCELRKMDLSAYSYDDLEKKGLEDADKNAFQFSCRYPKQKVGKKIQLHIEDADGYVFSRNIKLENLDPYIDLDTVYSSDRKISGKTWSDCAVTIRYGKKTYRTRANKSGRFSVKVKSQRAGTKIKVSVSSPQGYTSSITEKTKLSSGSVYINGNIYRNSSSVSVTVRRPGKGDKVVVKAAGKTYIKQIKANGKKKKILFKLKKKPSAGSKVSVELQDKFGKKKDNEKVMVYYGNTISKGMSASHASLTTWGYPVRKNDYGTGSVQWVFQSGNSYLYAYVRAGKVVGIQRINI